MHSFKFFAIILVIFPICGIKGQSSYTSLNGLYYYVQEQQSFTWNQAVIACSKVNMDLVTIDTKEKMDDLLKLLQKYQVEEEKMENVLDISGHTDWKLVPYKYVADFWVGSLGVYPEFSWYSNGRPVIPSIWHNKAPENNANSHCVYAKAYETTPFYGLVNSNCGETKGFLCENRIEQKCCAKKVNVFLKVTQNRL